MEMRLNVVAFLRMVRNLPQLPFTDDAALWLCFAHALWLDRITHCPPFSDHYNFELLTTVYGRSIVISHLRIFSLEFTSEKRLLRT